MGGLGPVVTNSSVEGLCRDLMEASDPDQRASLLSRAVGHPDSVEHLLGLGRASASALPAYALAAATLAGEITRRRGEPVHSAAAFRLRGQALRALGRHAEAISAFDDAGRSAEAAGDRVLGAVVRIGAVDSLGMLGRYDEASSLGAELARDLSEAGASVEAGRAMANLGSVEFRRDRYAQALHWYERAAAALASADDPLLLTGVQINRANVLTQLGRSTEATELYERALAAYGSLGRQIDQAVVLTNLGFLHSTSGRFGPALECLGRACEAFREAGRNQDAARCEIDRAEAYRAVNLHPEAEACGSRAIELLEDLELPYDRARAQVGRAGSLLVLGRAAEALDALGAADAVFRSQGNRLQRAHIGLIRAYLLREQGEPEAARAEATSAARVFGRRGLRGWSAEARWLTADMDMQAGQDAGARMQRVRRDAAATHRRWLEARAERSLAASLMARGSRSAALRHLRRGVLTLEEARTMIAPEAAHVAFLGDKLGIYEDLVLALLAEQRDHEAFEWIERARSRLLLDRICQAIAGPIPAPQPSPLQSKVDCLRAELSRAYHRGADFADHPPDRRLSGTTVRDAAAVRELEREYGEALTRLEAATGEPAFHTRTGVSVGEVQQCLGADEALIEYFISGQAVFALAVSHSGLRTYRLPIELERLRLLSRRLRYHLQRPELGSYLPGLGCEGPSPALLDLLEQLHEALLAPLASVIDLYSRLVIAPHSILHGIPFHALRHADGYNLDRWEMVYTPSAAIWVSGRLRPRSRPRRGGSPLLMAMPLPGIEEAGAEVADVGQVLENATVLSGEAATLAEFHRCSPGRGIIHLATHGRFRRDNPLFSGLQLADGWLLARDLYELRLDCDLATLSACRTGVASMLGGDEPFGLVRGFLAAGARSVAASLWPVHDGATRALMVRFYQGIAAGLSSATSLTLAQRGTRQDCPHPYFWAAFQLFGQR